MNETISTSLTDGYTLVGEALKSKTTHLTVREITKGDAANDEVQHVVNLTADVIAGFEGGTITLTDAIGNSVTTAAIGANQTLAQLTTAINAAITAYDAGRAGSNAAPNFAATVTSSGTDLILTFDQDDSGTSGTDRGNTNHLLATATFNAATATAGLETSFAKGDITINGVEIFNTAIASDTFAGKLT